MWTDVEMKQSRCPCPTHLGSTRKFFTVCPQEGTIFPNKEKDSGAKGWLGTWPLEKGMFQAWGTDWAVGGEWQAGCMMAASPTLHIYIFIDLSVHPPWGRDLAHSCLHPSAGSVDTQLKLLIEPRINECYWSFWGLKLLIYEMRISER